MSIAAQSDISVIVCAYTERRWAVLQAALAALRAQTLRPCEIILVIDRNPALLARARACLRGIQVVENRGVSGAAGARNAALPFARGAILAFLDDDAIPLPDWLERLAAHFRDPGVVGVGGCSLPRWHGPPPSWFPPEFGWVIGCTYRGMPERVAPVRNLWGVSMALRRDALLQAGAFNTALGRVCALPIGCEETELCIRIRQRCPRWRLLYDPDAVVLHDVPPERARPRYFLARCFHEGRSKAVMARLVGAADGLRAERSYVLRVLPRCLLRNLYRVGSGRDVAGGVGRVVAVLAGTAATLAGYLHAQSLQLELSSTLRGEEEPADATGVAHRHRHAPVPAAHGRH